MTRIVTGVVVLTMLSGAPALCAQAPPDAPLPVATMKQLMVDVIHPASNALLLLINRGGPDDEKEWAEARRSALTLAESGNLLILRNRATAWVADAKMLTEAGSAAYKTAEANDAKALAALADRIDASCTTCHKHARPAIFPNSR